MKYLLSAILLWSVTTVSLFAESCGQAKSTRSFVGTNSIRASVKQSKGTPHEINYQGWIGDASDTNAITDDLDMIFRLYDAETGGTLKWNETQNAVSVNKGIFNVLLGSVNPIPSDIFTGDPLWLETQVEDDTLSPRKKLVSVGYAIKSEEAEHSVYSDTADYALAGPGVGDNDWTIDENNMYSTVPGSVGVGVASPTEKLDVDGAINTSSLYKIGGDRVLSNAGTNNIFVGVGAGENNTGYRNTFLGYSAGYFNTAGSENTFLGYWAGRSNTTGDYNTFLGYWAGYSNTTGGYNTFSGNFAGHSNTTGRWNTFSGTSAGSNNTTGNFNTFSGYGAGYSNTTGHQNTFSGRGAGYHNTTGISNTFLGHWAGINNTEGDSSVFIGYQAGYYAAGSNKLYIANGSDSTNVLIYGEFDNRRIGLRTTSPTAALDVNGANGYDQIRMRTSFTPTGTSDTHGNTGDIAWDDECIYIKTGSGWKRATLSTF